MKSDKIKVRMAEYKISSTPDILITIGLGSCVGIAVYDNINKIGGLIHIMLPENRKSSNPAKYADTGIPLLIDKLESRGARKRNLVAKIAGGARMFNIDSQNSNMMVGKRNIEKVKSILIEENIKLAGEDVGKNYGRTMEFYTENGDVKVRSYKSDEIIL